MNAKQMDTGVSLRAAALVGGVGLLLMIVLAIFAYGNVIPSSQVVERALGGGWFRVWSG